MILTAFAAISALLIYLCRRQITNPQCHGFYRFWAFEIVLWQFLNHLPVWHRDLISVNQLLSLILMLAALSLLIGGFSVLRRAGRRDAQQSDGTLFPFERTASLVTTGTYQYIRHPMYGALLLFNWGVFCKDPGAIDFILASAASVFLYLSGWMEEKENIEFFGADYLDYQKSSKMFIPFII